MLRRRRLLTAAPALGVLMVGRFGHAAARNIEVTVPGNALGALVAAVGGGSIRLRIDRSLAATSFALPNQAPVAVVDRVLLKGAGPARDRYLDDARNATRVASNVRDALVKSLPHLAKEFRAQHRNWARPFARQALRWTQKLAGSKVRGANIKDTYDRVYLLEWAGAKVSPTSRAAAPLKLARAPREPATPSPEAYAAYIDDLVAAMF